MSHMIQPHRHRHRHRHPRRHRFDRLTAKGDSYKTHRRTARRTATLRETDRLTDSPTDDRRDEQPTHGPEASSDDNHKPFQVKHSHKPTYDTYAIIIPRRHSHLLSNDITVDTLSPQTSTPFTLSARFLGPCIRYIARPCARLHNPHRHLT
ncbi:hypothetical protein LZ31DRAFT_69993 [Colletotrichum somersetense]|nr:hypothetical protein LZ31DRAFT_69993 [Colletotrichum somersetense]